MRKIFNEPVSQIGVKDLMYTVNQNKRNSSYRTMSSQYSWETSSDAISNLLGCTVFGNLYLSLILWKYVMITIIE